MTITLVTALNDQARTTNGALTNATSLNANVDLFFLAGASRGKDIEPQFIKAYNENPELALRILQWARDVRGGAGERATYRNLLRTLLEARSLTPVTVESEDGDTVLTVGQVMLRKTPVIGRWDDVLVAFGTKAERHALRMIAAALRDGDGLCAKWMPRQGKDANKIRAYLQMTPADYRKMLVTLSSTVEQKMCAREWDKIEYSHVPSVASARYQKAFGRHDFERYSQYLSQVEKGEAKINAGAVYPYDVVRSLRSGDVRAANAQWEALPDYLEGSNENILPVVDVSGSMGVQVSGSVSAMEVAVSLGLYLSERSRGVYENSFITFSARPSMVTVSGTLKQRMDQMIRSDWGYNTNLQAVFETVLDAAVRHTVDASVMPTMLLILSDMEFDQAICDGRDTSAMEMIRQSYANAGYTLPRIVFWNLNGRAGNLPVTYREDGTALVSGFSPSIMTSLLGGSKFNPEQIMLDTVMNPRYDL